MRKAWTIGLAAAAMAGLCLTAIGGTEHERIADAGASVTPYYVRGPRIIHVPRPGEKIEERGDVRASAGRRAEPVLSNESVDDDIAPPPRHRAAAPKRRVESNRVAPKPAVRKTPRWKLGSEAPPPPPPPPAPLGPRRAVLSAPPPRAEGLSPIYPTPRFETNAKPAEKFDRPSQTEAAAGPPPAVTAPPLPDELPPAAEN
jgi:hypothetical protein